MFIITLTQSKLHHRDKRFLVFPESGGRHARTQFITGFGVPVDLDRESVTVGYVLKTIFFIPTKAADWYPTLFYPDKDMKRTVRELSGNSSTVIENDGPVNNRDEKVEVDEESIANLMKRHNSRWNLYKGLEVISESNGHLGRPCVLRAICESSEASFNHKSGILGELFRIILT